MGCLALLILGMITWFATYIFVALLSWFLGFTLTFGLVTAIWLILLVLKLLF